jgi:ABC-type protease/lipase transport system fused ATPase/permease subunit
VAKQKKNEIRRAAGVLAPIIPILALISCVVNVLALTGSFYMLQIYDRVLSSRSIPTLIALSMLAIALYLFQGGLEIVRSQVLVRIASRLDRQLTTMTYDAVVRLRSFVGSQASPMQPLRDVDAIRTFLSGQAPVAILDMPWIPLYLGFVFLLHPVLGWATTAGALFLISLTLLTERLMRNPT